MPSEVVIRLATPEDMDRFYAGDKDSMYYSSRAVVAERDGELIGMGGVCRVNSQMQVFTDIRVSDMSKRDIIKAARMVLEIVSRYTSVVAYADPALCTAEGFAKHFGFQLTGVTLNGSKQLYRVRP